MKTIVFSIGLNVGESEPADQLQKTLYALANAGGTVRDIMLGAATWQGIPERFLQARVTVGSSAQAYSMAQSLAYHLAQAAIGVWREGANSWKLVDARGIVTQGGTHGEFPVLFAPLRNVDRPARGIMNAAERGEVDTVGHSSVQPWSAGEVFPAVIARLENAGEYAGHELTIGAFREVYASYDDAHEVARWTCQHGRINPERYAQLMPGAGRSMAAYGAASN